ncbi:MAG: ABC transporter permease [Tepidisphaeraceae bacterium]|jgi:ribose transport system permease protein
MKKELGIGALLLIVCGVVAWMNPRFLSQDNLRNQAHQIGMFGIYSIGMGLIIITGGIDLSVGSVFALQGVLLSIMLVGRHWPWPVATFCAIAGVVFLGAVHGFLVAKARLQPFIVTLAGLLLYRGLARFIANDETKGFGDRNFGSLRSIATGHVYGVPTSFVFLIVIATVMYVVLHRSVYGRYLFAVGRNKEAARFSGINTGLVIGSVYAVSMLLASISGITMAFDANSIVPSSHANFYEVYGIAAAVLGGCSLLGGEGSILGIVLGTALLQVLQNLVNLLGIRSSLNFAVMGAVILLGALIDVLLSRRGARQRFASTRQATAPPPPPAG